MKRQYWTIEEVEHLKEHYYDSEMEDLVKKLNRPPSKIYNKAYSLGLKRNPKFMDTTENLVKHSHKSRFKKGHTPWNIGKKGFMGANRTSFKKGHTPKNYRPVGSVNIRADRYSWIKVEDPDKWDLLHRVVWRIHHGEIPEGMNVQFKNGNKQDIRIENLELVSKKANMKRNARHNYTAEINAVIHARAVLKRHINKLSKTKDHA